MGRFYYTKNSFSKHKHTVVDYKLKINLKSGMWKCENVELI